LFWYVVQFVMQYTSNDWYQPSLRHVAESLRSKIRRGEDSGSRLGEPRPPG